MYSAVSVSGHFLTVSGNWVADKLTTCLTPPTCYACMFEYEDNTAYFEKKIVD